MIKFIAALVLAITALTGCTAPAEAPVTSSLDSYAAGAWEAFDDSGAAEFIPAEGGRVELIGMDAEGFPYADESMITVVGPDGYTFLFQISK